MTQNEKQMSNAEQQKKIGKRFKELIKEFDGDQETTAKYLNYSKTSISRFCSGTCPLPDEIIKKLSAKWDVREEYIKCIDDYKTISEEVEAFREHIRSTDDLLIKLLRSQNHHITFNSASKHTSSVETPENMAVLGSDDLVVCIDGTKIDMLSFQYMLDDIYDYIDFVLSRNSIYTERQSEIIGAEYARKAERREKMTLNILTSGKFEKDENGQYIIDPDQL